MNDQPVVADEFAVVHHGPELAIRIQNCTRDLDNILRLIEGESIQILAYGFYNDYNGTTLLVVSEYPGAARAAVELAGYKCETMPVIWIEVPYRLGLAARLAKQLRASGVGIVYTYSSWTDGQQAILVFRTTQDELAIEILSAVLEGLSLTPCLLANFGRPSAPLVGKL